MITKKKLNRNEILKQTRHELASIRACYVTLIKTYEQKIMLYRAEIATIDRMMKDDNTF